MNRDDPEGQADLGFDDGGPDHARLRSFDADFTPRPVAIQGARAISDDFNLYPGRILDPCAGAGVFGQAFRDVWNNSMRCAIEPREEEREHLTRNYEEFTIGRRFQEFGQNSTMEHHYRGCDLIMTNPPFSEWADAVQGLPDLLTRRGLLVLLGLSTWGQSAGGSGVFREHPPIAQMRITGRISFRGPGLNPHTGKPWGSDQRDYSWWVWTRRDQRRPVGCADGRWRCWNLPRLPTEYRRWVERPGTERV